MSLGGSNKYQVTKNYQGISNKGERERVTRFFATPSALLRASAKNDNQAAHSRSGGRG